MLQQPQPSDLVNDVAPFAAGEFPFAESADVPAIVGLNERVSEERYWNDRPAHGRIVAQFAGQSQKTSYNLTNSPVVVLGSRSDCDWSCPGSGLAEQQACFLFIDRRIYCVDLTGTYALNVRGGRFQQIWVHNGSYVDVGKLRLRLHTGAVFEEESESGSHEEIQTLDDDAIADERRIATEADDFHCRRHLELTKSGGAAPWRYELTRNITLIGRDSPSTIRLKDPALSVVSSALVQTRTGVWYVNIQSTPFGNNGSREKFPSRDRQGDTPARCVLWQPGRAFQLGRFQLQLFEEAIEP